MGHETEATARWHLNVLRDAMPEGTTHYEDRGLHTFFCFDRSFLQHYDIGGESVTQRRPDLVWLSDWSLTGRFRIHLDQVA